MKGSVDSFIVVIIGTVLIIGVVVAISGVIGQKVKNDACNYLFKNKISGIIDRACQIGDSDIDDISKIELLDCVTYAEFKGSDMNLEYRLKNEDFIRKINTQCPYGMNSVIFDFSKEGGKLDASKAKEYDVVITVKEVFIPRCTGDAAICTLFGVSSSSPLDKCGGQKGCSLVKTRDTSCRRAICPDIDKCLGTVIPCYSFHDIVDASGNIIVKGEEACEKQIGCVWNG